VFILINNADISFSFNPFHYALPDNLTKQYTFSVEF